jgi:8-oxo-dGTP pyrophosphatase MutT (NUDIX family)
MSSFTESKIDNFINYLEIWKSNKTTEEYLLDYNESKEESEYKNQMLKFLNDKNPFGRDNLEGHFTGSSWIVTEDNTRALITHHKKLGLKLQLGGHCDGDSDILRVALREAFEESGIPDIKFCRQIFDIDIHIIPCKNEVPEHYHYDIRFLFTVDNNADFIVSPESTKLEWITNDFDTNGCTYGFNRMFEKWKNMNLNDYDFEKLM